MREFLIFHLWGAALLLGNPGRGRHTPGQAHPGRSALLGLMAGALGLKERTRKDTTGWPADWAWASWCAGAARRLSTSTPWRCQDARQNAVYATRREELAAWTRRTIPW